MRPFGREENEERKSDRAGSDFLEELLAQFFSRIKCGRTAAKKEVGMREFREQLLGIIEKNSRIDLKELAVILGVEEIDVVNELAAMEAEGIICGYHTLIDWDKTSLDKISALIEVRVTPQR